MYAPVGTMQKSSLFCLKALSSPPIKIASLNFWFIAQSDRALANSASSDLWGENSSFIRTVLFFRYTSKGVTRPPSAVPTHGGGLETATNPMLFALRAGIMYDVAMYPVCAPPWNPVNSVDTFRFFESTSTRIVKAVLWIDLKRSILVLNLSCLCSACRAF